ncbi:ABC transporter permease [Paenibacillus sepulcri]|uniref:ABC transporter permease n=1 Tax=Paenibacillus sepulcri TaxID=359917 RepID=A0ABS7C5A8_9BACL|nr:ABC transporter permease [Paenibacillus sepulcri]
MGPFIRKDFLVLWRDRTEMIISILTSLVIIVILGFTTSSWVEKSDVPLQMTVAIVNKDNEAAALAQFRSSSASLSLSGKFTSSLENQPEQILPASLLMQRMKEQSFITTNVMDSETARNQLQHKDIEAIITIPEGFTLAALNKMLLNEGGGAAITLTADHRSSMRIDVLQDLINEFMQSLNLQSAIDHTLDTRTAAPDLTEAVSPAGGLETIAGVKPLTSFQYYAIAISIVFALFISITTAVKAITEKREHVFQRILLAGSHPFQYLAGKVGSTFCMSLLQLSILILLSHFIFNLFPGRSLQFWLGMAMITIATSLSVAAFSALFTSMTFRMKDSAASGLFSLIIGILGTIGGSFIPKYILPDWLKQVGEWTPNGVSLSVFIQWIGQDSFTVLTTPFLKMAVFSIMLIVLGCLLFPRRGRI